MSHLNHGLPRTVLSQTNIPFSLAIFGYIILYTIHINFELILNIVNLLFYTTLIVYLLSIIQAESSGDTRSRQSFEIILAIIGVIAGLIGIISILGFLLWIAS